MHPQKIKTDNKYGTNFSLLSGQTRYMYGIDDSIDFYDMQEWGTHEGVEGSEIYFYDLKTRKIYSPFKKEKNVLYAKPLWQNDYIYILQGDFNKNCIEIYQYLPENSLELIYEQSLLDMSLYNLELTPGDKVYLTSTDFETFNCYWPKRFKMKFIEEHENVIYIDKNRLFIQYDKNFDGDFSEDIVKITDFSNNTLSEEDGWLQQFPDGSWHIVN